MTPAPEIRANDLVRERQVIQQKLRETLEFDELRAKRLERQLIIERDRPRASDIIRAGMWHELAYLSAFAGRTEQALSRLDETQRIGFDDLGIILSRAFILEMGGRLTEARDVIEMLDAANIIEPSRKFLVPHYMELGMFKSATEIVTDIEEYDPYALVAKAILEEHGVDDLEVTKRLEFAASMVIQRVGHPLVDYKLFAMRGEGILYQIVAKGSIEELGKLGVELSDALVDNFYGVLNEILCIDVIPFVPGNQSRQMEVFRVSV